MLQVYYTNCVNELIAQSYLFQHFWRKKVALSGGEKDVIETSITRKILGQPLVILNRVRVFRNPKVVRVVLLLISER